jgi:hypothetical protein
MAKIMKVIVTGYVIRYPLAGMMLAFFHYLMGLQRLGHQVIYVEESGWDNSCYDPTTGSHSDDPTGGIKALTAMAGRFGFELPVCYVNRQTGATVGISRAQLRNDLASADLLLNIGGTCSLPDFELCRRRALIDMDPMFTQAGLFAGEDLGEYHVHFSYGTNIGRAECSVPDAGINWLPTVPPVVTEIWSDWASETQAHHKTLTTVCNWSAYGAIEYDGEHYGQKDQEFMRLLDVPGATSEHLELALSGADDATKNALRRAGWSLRDAEDVTIDFESYANYIGRSRGEFSAAKNAYVKTRSGWFSDRSVCYLAAGRPVILQDTGIRRWLPENSGIMTFSDAQEAIQCLESLRSDYPTRCRSARELAEDYFGHTVSLPKLLDRAFGDAPADAESHAKTISES